MLTQHFDYPHDEVQTDQIVVHLRPIPSNT